MRKQKQEWFWEIVIVVALLMIWFAAGSAVVHGQTVVNTLDCLNVQRAQFGLRPLKLDPHLQAAAENAAVQRAQRRISGHLKYKLQGRKRVPTAVAGKAEGVAARNGRSYGPAGRVWDHRDVFACYQATGSGRKGNFDFKDFRYAGCASALGADGHWYYQLNLR